MLKAWLSLLTAACLTQAAQSTTTSDLLQIPDATNASLLRQDVFGYSVEPSSTYAYTQSQLATTLLASLRDIIGTAPPIRIGGTTADEITVLPSVPGPSHYSSSDTGSSGGNNDAASITLDPAWYSTWAHYFPAGTQFIYTLNFRNTSGNWSNARAEASAALAALGRNLTRLELGNEVDHYISKHWRAPGWGVAQYIPQFRALSALVSALPAYAAAGSPGFQAGVIADPPAVPDQQDEADDFSIANLTTAGLVRDTATNIASYAVHLYPQSTCDAARRARLSLTTLSNHSVLLRNVSQYVSEQRAAVSVGHAPLVLGETNSVSCGGASGVSDVFAAALWTADYVLTAASLGIQQVFFHLGEQSEYAAFTPLPYTYKSENLTAGVRANAYAHLFLAQVLKTAGSGATVKALPGANASDFSGFAVYGGRDARGIVLLDTGVWNSTQGASNPSTLHATDSTFASGGARPVRNVRVATPWCEGQAVEIVRMRAPGSNAKSGVDVSGLSFDMRTGGVVGKLEAEKVVVGKGGVLQLGVDRAQGVFVAKAG